MTAILTPVPSFRETAIADGFVFECSCGELYCDVDAAYSCRKCRNYCVFGYCTHVVDISTGNVVAGEVPEYEEYERARKYAEAKWAEERRFMDNYEAEMAAIEALEAELAAAAALEVYEDSLWEIQDRLMGV